MMDELNQIYIFLEKISTDFLMLNLWGITSKFRIVILFVVDLQTSFRMQIVGMVYLHIKFHTSDSNHQSITAVKQES
jgi:hypothetical protein